MLRKPCWRKGERPRERQRKFMSKFAEKLKVKAEEIKLRADERNSLRENLLTYMAYHPMPEEQIFKVRAIETRQIIAFFNSNRFRGSAAGMFAVFCLVVIPAMAENSLPGDALYPVKISFNEELRGVLASDPYKKIEWETERLGRRVAEAQLLSDSGKLTPIAEAEVVGAIKRHSEAAKESIESIRQDDNDEAAIAEITLSSSLEVSADVLVKGKSSVSSTSALTNAVNEARAVVTANSNGPSYQKLMSRLEIDTTRAYEYLDSLSSTISPEVEREIEKRIVDIKRKVEKAEIVKQGGDELAAIKILVEALGDTNKVISFMTNLELRNKVNLQDLVPSAPTEEEQKSKILESLSTLDVSITAVNSAIAALATTSSNYAELSAKAKNYADLKQATLEAFESNDFNKAEVSLDAADNLIKRLSSDLKGLGMEVKVNVSNGTTTPSLLNR